MKIGITGASGLIGRALRRRLLERGHELLLFQRASSTAQTSSDQEEIVAWDAFGPPPQGQVLGNLDAIFHLAGEPIAGWWWTAAHKARIRESRVLGTRNLVEGLRRCPRRPSVLIQASAVGFYGDRGTEELTEASLRGEGFLPEVCAQWEEEARKAVDFGVRVVSLRTGLVLSAEGGVLPRMSLPFKCGLGGRLGGGEQFMSWIHIQDQVRLMEFALEKDEIAGPLNAAAPTPVCNRDFTRILGEVLRRPTFFRVPRFALRLTLGEMGEALLLQGQRVIPEKARASGFSFQFPSLEEALVDLFC